MIENTKLTLLCISIQFNGQNDFEVGRVFADGPGDLGSIPGRVIPKTLKMVLDTALLNTQQYKVRIKNKVEQSRERSRAPRIPRCSSYWKGSLRVALSTGVANLTLYIGSNNGF